MPGYVYILTSRQGRIYIGSTDHLHRRLDQHKENKVKSTALRGPWMTAYSAVFSSLTEARQAEYYLKRQKSRHVLQAVIEGTFEWPPEFIRIDQRQDSPI
jgi:predicted GIY-YIG superfamily endonuclease